VDFELLHRIIDDKTADLEAEREELAEETEQRRQRVAAVERFVESTELQAGAAEIRRRLLDLEAPQREIEDRIRATEHEAREAVAEHLAIATVRDRSQEELSDARRALGDLQAELSEVRRAGNQIQRDLSAAQEGAAARRVLDALPFVVCPRCEQSLESRKVDGDHCIVCQQPEPEVQDEVQTTRRLDAQLKETESLQGQLEEAVAQARALVDRLGATAAENAAAVATARDGASESFNGRILNLRGELGRLRGESAALAAGLPIEQAVAKERLEIESSKPEIARIEDQAASRRRDLSPRGRARVEELSVLFSEILHAFSLPWLKTAEVGRDTYLPLVNGLGRRAISSGGMKTTTNVAYYLAIFALGLRDSEVLTPSFLMLDSIRKDSGAGDRDLARSDRIYSYLRTLQELRTSTPAARDFQLLVVDNDLPADFERTFNTMRIDPDSPLVRGI
jgi:cell division septation protein DedD